jgi:hypothetical protein
MDRGKKALEGTVLHGSNVLHGSKDTLITWQKKALEVGNNLVHGSNILHCHILVKHSPKFNETTNGITP